MVLPDDRAQVQAQLARIRDAYDPSLAPAPAMRSAAEIPAVGDPPMWMLGQAEEETRAAMAAAERAEAARQHAGDPSGGGDPGQAAPDPSPLTQAEDYRP